MVSSGDCAGMIENVDGFRSDSHKGRNLSGLESHLQIPEGSHEGCPYRILIPEGSHKGCPYRIPKGHLGLPNLRVKNSLAKESIR